MLVKQCYVGKSFYKLLTVQIEKIHVIDTTNEKHNISNNINLIFNTYKCLFSRLLLRIFDVVFFHGSSNMAV